MSRFWTRPGLARSDVQTSATIVARSNVKQKPYDDQRVRNALQMAVDNATVLKLGIDGPGTVGENHHVAPIHPEYAELPKKSRDIAGAKKLMTDAGQIDFEHDLITSDEEWYKNTGDAIAAQLREAGFKVKRTVLPGSTFWNDWTKYPVFHDRLEHAAARRAGAGARLPHRRSLERDRLFEPGVRRQARKGARNSRPERPQGC